MLRDIAGHSDGMLFRQSIVPSFKVAQLWILCHTSKDFYGMFRPYVLSCLDLKDDQLQRAFVARLLNAIARKKWPSEMRSATMCRATMAELISKGHDLDQRDDSGMTVLMWASYNGQADTARVLVKHGASLEAVDREDGMTALLWASYEGHADTVRVLVEHRASLEAVDREDGVTALLWASYEGSVDAVVVLLEHGASLEAVDEKGKTALQLALDNDKRKVTKVLCKHGARGALCYAAKNNLRGMVAELISKGHDLEECDKRGNTALQLASYYGNRKVEKVLCKHGARGAFCYAAKNDLRDMVEELISKGHDLEECDKRGNTALQLASDYGNRSVAKVLCKHGARGALCYAAKNDLLRDMVEELISKGHDLEECDKDGTTALELAAEANDGEGHIEVVGGIRANADQERRQSRGGRQGR
jgi:ankyrin repeat protein